MSIQLPNAAYYDAYQRTARLMFGASEYRQEYVRGAICWPMMQGIGLNNRSIEGFALVAGQDCDTGKITVYDDRTFVTVDPVIDPDTGDVQFDGLAGWFNRNWATFYARDYFWHGDEETNKRNLLSVLRSKLIAPSPYLLQVPWTDDSQAEHALWEALSLGRLRYRKGGELHKQMQRFQAQPLEVLPGVHALRCLMAGYERFPWRTRHAA